MPFVLPFLLLLAILAPTTPAASDPLPPGLARALATLHEPGSGSTPSPAPDGTWRWHDATDGMTSLLGRHGLDVGPADASWTLRLALAGCGRGDVIAPTTDTTPVRVGRRIEYRRPGLVEWYVQDRRGVEQLFTLEAPPAGHAATPIALVLEHSGGLQPELAAGARDVVFRADTGATALHYSGLLVLDADERELPAWIELAPGRLVLRIDDRGARYPILVDPVIAIEQAQLDAFDGELGDELGASVAVDGDTAVVGAPGEDSGGSNAGAVYVFVRSGETWTQQAKIVAPAPLPNDRFGISVDIDGDTLLVGCPQITFPLAPSGKAFVFTRSGSVWTLEETLVPAGALSGDQVGRSVALDVDTALIGAPFRDDNGLQSGAAYVFTRSGTTWTQEDVLLPDDGETEDQFGIAVDVEGDEAVVGAWLDLVVSDEPRSGSAYVFARDTGAWSQQAKLFDEDPKENDNLGQWVVISGERIAVAAPGDDKDQGKILTFVEDSENLGAWILEQELKASDGDDDHLFGLSFQLDGDILVSGAPGADSTRGQGYFFSLQLVAGGEGEEDMLVWIEDDIFQQSAPAGAALLGSGAAISGTTVVLGAPAGNGPVDDSGSAIVFIATTTGTWTDLGEGLGEAPDGTSKVPLLEGFGPLVGGIDVTLSLTKAEDDGVAALVLGFSRIDAPFKGGVLVPAPDLLLLNLPLDGDGELIFTFPWTLLLPPSFPVYFQYWVTDPDGLFGFTASNGLEALNAPGT